MSEYPKVEDSAFQTTATSVHSFINSIPPENEHKIIHVSCGNDEWNPTESELQEIKEAFNKAVVSKTDSAIITRAGIFISEVYTNDNTEVIVCSAGSKK